MMTDTWKQRMDRHEAFLECRPVDRPLIRPWRSGYYPAEQFPCGTSRWQTGAILRPEDVSFAPFADDYERLYESQQNSDGDFGYVGSAYWGIPWLEAIWVARSRWPRRIAVPSHVCRASIAAEGRDRSRRQRVAGCTAAVHAGTRRFRGGPLSGVPAAAARARRRGCRHAGPNDLRDRLFRRTGDDAGVSRPLRRTRLAVIERLHAAIPAWNGIHAAGGYPSIVWSRRTVAYHQEDSAAVLNPSIFREFLLPALRIGLSRGGGELHPPPLGMSLSGRYSIGGRFLRRLADQRRSPRHGTAGLRADRHVQEDPSRRPTAVALGRV